ncbi:hypothetical protein CP532_2174 [Ophiocordyceps camponoti-leonardi (nom. inval.)]|nr:hypothetical protein CP532_2174 [Ophiocordyceps camponoti-leonardi (nom. inval.)]
MKSISVLAVAVGLVSAASVPPQLAERSLFMPSLKDFFRREDKAQNGTASRGNGQERGNGNDNRNNGENNNNNNNNNGNNNENNNNENNRNNGNNNNNNGNIQNLNGNDLNNLLQQSGQCQAFIQNGCNLNFNGNQNFNNQNENNNNNNNGNNNNNVQNLNSNDLNNLLQQSGQCQSFIQSGCNFNNNNLVNGQNFNNFNQQMIAVLAGNVHQLAVNLSPQIGQVVTVSAVNGLNLVQVMQLNNVLSFVPMMGQILVSQGLQANNINSMLVQPIVSSINSNGLNLNSIQGGVESIKSVNVVPVK